MAGRPTDYKPEYCEKVIELGKQGKSIVQIASMLDQAKQTLYDWEKVHPAFLDSLTRARQESQVWWENMGQAGLVTKEFQPSLWAKQVSCRFPDDYRDKQTIEHAGKVETTAPVLNIFTSDKKDG